MAAGRLASGSPTLWQLGDARVTIPAMRALPLRLAILALGLASCTSVATASRTPSPRPTATPRPTAPSVPSELRGVWSTTLSNGALLTLTLADTGYEIKNDIETVRGGLRVAGGEITFLRSGACDGVGTYRWSLTGGRLAFEPVGDDQCPGRAGVIVGHTYTPSGV
jgi:hypothetical protein